MDIGRIFDSLLDWKPGLNEGQEYLLRRLMLVNNAKEFDNFPVGEIRQIQEQLLRSDGDPGRQSEMKNATQHLSPIVSGVGFI